MVSGALGSAVFSAVTGVLLTRRYPLVVEGVRCCEVAAHHHRRQASIRRQDGASLNCSSFYIVLDELPRTPFGRSSYRRSGLGRTSGVGGHTRYPPRYRPYLEKPPPRLARVGSVRAPGKSDRSDPEQQRAGTPRRMSRAHNGLFYFRRFLTAFSTLSTPLFEPPLPFLAPDTFSLAAFLAAPSIFLPMPAMLITLL